MSFDIHYFSLCSAHTHTQTRVQGAEEKRRQERKCSKGWLLSCIHFGVFSLCAAKQIRKRAHLSSLKTITSDNNFLDAEIITDSHVKYIGYYVDILGHPTSATTKVYYPFELGVMSFNDAIASYCRRC